MFTVPDPSLSPTPAAHAAIAFFATARFTVADQPERRLVYTLFDHDDGLAVTFFTGEKDGWLNIKFSPTLEQLGLMCLEATDDGRSVIVTKAEAEATGLLADHRVASALDLMLDIPRRSEWHGDDWRTLVGGDEDDGDDVSYISIDLDPDDNDDAGGEDDDMAQFG